MLLTTELSSEIIFSFHLSFKLTNVTVLHIELRYWHKMPHIKRKERSVLTLGTFCLFGITALFHVASRGAGAKSATVKYTY